jgi:hypothetical protein
MLRLFSGGLAAACIIHALTGPAAAAGEGQMRFEWQLEGPAQACGSNCRSWISATGYITADTPRMFEVFAADPKVRGAVLVLDSDGGSVLGAIALGRAIRRLDMITTVGKTRPLAPTAGGDRRATLSPKANCESMCAFLLLGGMHRYVPREARVLVHQIWLGKKRKTALESSYSAEELNLVQRDIGRLALYTVEMGGAIELLETASRIPPWEPLRLLSAEELRRMRVTTLDKLFGSKPSAPSAEAPAASMVTVGQPHDPDN